MTTFVDTSALFALLDADDESHGRARDWLSARGSSSNGPLLTHSYVIVESTALVQRRLGRAAVKAMLEDLLPPFSIVFVDEPLHRAAVSAYLAAGDGGASLVDWVSFELMRHRGISQAFAFDRDFDRAGFTSVP